MSNVLAYEAERLGFKTKVDKLKEWREVMADSFASMCPRGFGRTAYHLMETLQQGLVPVHVRYTGW